jgi:hypothetical protein
MACQAGILIGFPQAREPRHELQSLQFQRED